MSAKLYWINGCPCAGKTFLGDYLATEGFVHLDGDECSYSKDPAEKAKWASLLQAFGAWFIGEKPADELWQPIILEIVERAKASLAEGKAVVVTLAIYASYVRDFIRKHLPDVQFIRLEVSDS